MPLPFPSLRHFQANEFSNPALVDGAFLAWLDAVRHTAGVPFKLTSDARTPEHNTKVGGSPGSLHVLGRAVDFVLRSWDRESLWKVVHAVCLTPAPNGCGIELELVQSDKDKHIHIGLLPNAASSRLILAID